MIISLFIFPFLSVSGTLYYFVNDDNKIDIALSKGTWDGCPPDAHRCDEKCIFEDDNWTTPCRHILPDGRSRAACVDWGHPYYCNKTDTCLPVDSQCGEDCFTHSITNKYNHLPQRYNCEGVCLTEEMSCKGSCEMARTVDKDNEEGEKNHVICGDRCITDNEVGKMYVCEGKCLHLVEPCNDGCTDGELVRNTSLSSSDHMMPYRAFCDGKCMEYKWICEGKCQYLQVPCGETCFEDRVLVFDEYFDFNLPYKCAAHAEYAEKQLRKYEKPIERSKWMCEGMAIPRNQSCNGECQIFKCATSGTCLVDDQRPCDGKQDCEDGSDEAIKICIGPKATCPGVYCSVEERFTCRNKVCGSCEEGKCSCSTSRHLSNWYEMTGSAGNESCRSIREPRNKTCSLEEVLNSKDWDRNYRFYRPVSHLCADESWCVTDHELCDGKVDCADASDETLCDCVGMWNCTTCRFRKEAKPFYCKDGLGCVEKEKVCDGEEQCDDGSDEFCEAMNCSKVYCKKLGVYQCDHLPCPADSQKDCSYGVRFCDGFCTDYSEPCNGTCKDYYVNCNGKCIRDNFQCNGECRPGQFRCGDECHSIRYERTYKVCNGIGECEDENDEKGCQCSGMWNCTECLVSHKFTCADGSACIQEDQICDGVSQCSDGSDEFCEKESCEDWGFCRATETYQCSSTPCKYSSGKEHCLDRTGRSPRYICNGSCLTESQPCNGKCLPGSTICNGTMTCLSDEFPCIGECKDNDKFDCGGNCKDRETHVYCGGKCWSHEALRRKHGSWYLAEDKQPELTRICNEECLTPDQPCHGSCPEDMLECNGTCWKYRDFYFDESKVWGKSSQRLPCNDNCDMFGVRCRNESVCINYSNVCDGEADCSDGSDEDQDFCSKCKEMKMWKDKGYTPNKHWKAHCITEAIDGTCPHKSHPFNCGQKCLMEDQFCPESDSCFEDKEYIHSCGDGKCVKAENVCDGEKDCVNGSDDKNCVGCRHGFWKCGEIFQCRGKPCDSLIRGKMFFKVK